MNSYETAPAHPFFSVTRSVVGREIRMGDTVCFMSEVDLSEVEAIRHRAHGTKPTYTAFVAKAVALALCEFPYANRRIYRSFWNPFARLRMQSFKSVDVSVAIERDIPAVEVATFIDVIRDVEHLSLVEIAAQLRALASCNESNNKQWREYNWIVTHLPCWVASLLVRLPAYFPSLWAKYRGGSVLISAPSKYGIDAIIGAWTAPLGVTFGIVKERPVVRAGNIVARPTFVFTLNFDRRVMAGAQAARFFKRILDILEHAQNEMAPYLLQAIEKVDSPMKAAENAYSDFVQSAMPASRATGGGMSAHSHGPVVVP